MKLGILTGPFENKELKEVAEGASTNEFSALEIACWPKAVGETRRYAGTAHIDVDNISVLLLLILNMRHFIFIFPSSITPFILSKSISILALFYYYLTVDP